jgi:hypothetical protein
MGCVVGSLSRAATFLHRLMHGDLLPMTLKESMLASHPYDFEHPPGMGYGLGVMCEPDGHGGRAVGHAGQGPGSTTVVFSFLDRERPQTLAAAVDVDDGDTFLKLIDQLRSRAGPP